MDGSSSSRINVHRTPGRRNVDIKVFDRKGNEVKKYEHANESPDGGVAPVRVNPQYSRILNCQMRSLLAAAEAHM